MYMFHNDYNQGCHPAVMERMLQMQSNQMQSYGLDTCCAAAAERIKKLCKNDKLAVHFLVGGTQTNLTVIAAALRPHQAVLGVETAHINVHETGAVEACGHKCITIPSSDGKIYEKEIRIIVNGSCHDDQWMSK